MFHYALEIFFVLNFKTHQLPTSEFETSGCPGPPTSPDFLSEGLFKCVSEPAPTMFSEPDLASHARLI